MEKKISVKASVKAIKQSELFIASKIRFGYSSGLPILSVKNDELCLTVPYLRYKITGEKDKTLVYPVRYIITVTLPELVPVSFSDLSYDQRFRNIDFSRPIGKFRHEAIQKYSQEEYSALRDELLNLYDRVANMLIYDCEYSDADEKRMRELLKLLIEPSVIPMYRAIDVDFYNKYIKEDETNG